jgi:hypothetical protein
MEWTSGYTCINAISTCIYTHKHQRIRYTIYTRVHIACLRGIIYIYIYIYIFFFFIFCILKFYCIYIYSIHNNLCVVLNLSSSEYGKKIKHIYAGRVSKELLQRKYVARTARFVLHHHSIAFEQFKN